MLVIEVDVPASLAFGVDIRGCFPGRSPTTGPTTRRNDDGKLTEVRRAGDGATGERLFLAKKVPLISSMARLKDVRHLYRHYRPSTDRIALRELLSRWRVNEITSL